MPLDSTSVHGKQISHITFANTIPKENARSKWYNKVYTEAFSRLGIQFEIEYLPMKRASVLANDGIYDGELGRVKGFDKKYPNLIQVEEPIWVANFIAYSTNTDIQELL